MVAAGPVAFRRLQLPLGVTGQVYLHSMPGRYEDWDRFEAAAADSHIQAIVCLADAAEIASKSPSYAKALRGKLPYTHYRCPIADFGVPADKDDFAAFIDSVAKRVRAGECVLVHCGAGIGRTGTFAGCLLIALGCSFDAAYAALKAAGSDAETNEQRSCVRWFASRRSA